MKRTTPGNHGVVLTCKVAGLELLHRVKSWDRRDASVSQDAQPKGRASERSATSETLDHSGFHATADKPSGPGLLSH